MNSQRIVTATISKTINARRTNRGARDVTGIQDWTGGKGKERSRVQRVDRRTRSCRSASAFDQPDFAGAGTLAGFFRRELHPLAFPQQLEHGAPHGTAVEEVLDPAFVADEAETLVDQQPSD